MKKWDRRFLTLAEAVSTWSKDPSTQVGAVIVRPDKTVASLGFNGFPINMGDDPADYADRDRKLSKIIHAEMNALLHARERVVGYTLYLHPFICCDRCAVHMIQAGIKRVVARELPDHLKERWGKITATSILYFEEADVEYTMYGPEHDGGDV